MLEHLVECPSGLSLTLREFIVRDEDILADRRSVKRGVAVSNLLDAITVNVQDPGPYELNDDKIDWGSVLLGDRLVALLYNRMATWGNVMDVRMRCPDCEKNSDQTVDLELLTIKKLPDKGREHIATKKPIYVTLPGAGTTVGFRLLVGRDEKTAERMQRKAKDSLSSSSLMFRITEVKGVEIQDQVRWVKNLGSKDASFLRASFDKYDGGVDHTYEFDCPKCGNEWEDDLVFGSDFLFPTYKETVDTNG